MLQKDATDSGESNGLKRFTGLASASRKVDSQFSDVQGTFLQIERPPDLAHFVKADASSPVI
jgi:hypothetical protein